MTDEKLNEQDVELAEAPAPPKVEPRVKVADTEVSLAVKTFSRAIKDDPEYWRSWQANIAMAFQDEMERSKNLKLPIHTIANTAARNFLMLLTSDVD